MITEQEHNNVQWRKVKLREVINDSYAGGTPNRSRDEYFGGGIPWVTSGEVNNPEISSTFENITIEGLNNSSAKWIPENSILVALYGATAGQVSMLRIKATSNQAVLAVIPNADVADTMFLFYQIVYNKDNLLYLAQGSGQPNLSKNLVDSLGISIPADLSAQRRIAAILASADKVIAATQKTIAKYKQIKQGMMEDLLKPKEGWKMVKLGECCEDIFSGKNTTRQDFGKYVVYGSTGPIGYSEDYEYDFDAVLVARVGANAGLVNKVSGLYDVSDNTLIIKILKNIDLNYLYYLLIHLNLNQFIFGSGQPLVTAGLLKKIEIPIPYKNDKPDLAEQRRIAAILSGIDAKIATEEKVLEKYEKVKKGLMERLLNEQ